MKEKKPIVKSVLDSNKAFDNLIKELRAGFSNSDIEKSLKIMAGFGGINEFEYKQVFLIKKSSDLFDAEFMHEVQWGIYDGGISALREIDNNLLSLYLCLIYLYSDCKKPMSLDFELYCPLIAVEKIIEHGDKRILNLWMIFISALICDYGKKKSVVEYCLTLINFLLSANCSDLNCFGIWFDKLLALEQAVEDLADATLYTNEEIAFEIKSILLLLDKTKIFDSKMYYTFCESLYLNLDVELPHYN
ncbi:hypothetical protein MNBD_GAMMA22-1531 [hydrothermal vent metagenome]|uniref:Uncharacterized protein n=1 Tax=hydrothermal vent metagenome TaxID=652676 RepID=A0A3B1AHR2_9ZZZZ